MYGLTLDVEVPYFACFREPKTTSLLLTYPVPPFTTLRGILSNALGLKRNDFYLQEKLSIGLRHLSLEPPVVELAKILKLKGEKVKGGLPSSFPSSPMYRYFLVKPTYRIYLGAEEGKLIAELETALKEPTRPLYLGQSDDVVDISNIKLIKSLSQVKAKEVDSIFPGISSGCQILKLPYKFKDEKTLIYYPDVLSLPPRYPWKLPHFMLLYQFGKEKVWLAKPRR